MVLKWYDSARSNPHASIIECRLKTVIKYISMHFLESRPKFFFLLFLLIFITALPIFAQIDKKGLILFYNPETNINNFASVKAMFDKYLSVYGNYKFQPFNKREIFEGEVEKIDSYTLLIVSSWHFRSLTKKAPLTPILIATRDGKFTFRKILSARKSISDVNDLSGKTVASSGSKKYTLSLLRKMFGKDKMELLSNIRILNVPKDIDALMSVGFGVAQAAITTEASLKQIGRINPKLKEKLTRLLISDEILMPIVSCGAKTDTDDIKTRDELVKILKNMGFTVSGKEKLGLLSVDEWIDIPSNLLEELNK